MTVEVPGGMPAGSVIITPSQMYTEIREMGKKVDHLADVIDPALTDIREDIAEVKTAIKDTRTDFAKSVAALKRAIIGVVAFVVTSVLGIVTAYIQSGRL